MRRLFEKCGSHLREFSIETPTHREYSMLFNDLRPSPILLATNLQHINITAFPFSGENFSILAQLTQLKTAVFKTCFKVFQTLLLHYITITINYTYSLTTLRRDLPISSEMHYDWNC